jgi:hypothetical protein
MALTPPPTQPFTQGTKYIRSAGGFGTMLSNINALDERAHDSSSA